MNYSFSPEWIDFLSMGKIRYDEKLRQIVTGEMQNYAFYYYDHAPSMNDQLLISSDPEYLKGRMEIPYFKARKYLPSPIQENLQKLVSEIYHQVHDELCEKRFNISQIGFVWNGGVVPYHSHFLPLSTPNETMTYFMALHESRHYDLQFNIKSESGAVESLKLLQKSRCTRVLFNSNLHHELKCSDEGLYMFFLFNSLQLKKEITPCADIGLEALK